MKDDTLLKDNGHLKFEVSSYLLIILYQLTNSNAPSYNVVEEIPFSMSKFAKTIILKINNFFQNLLSNQLIIFYIRPSQHIIL